MNKHPDSFDDDERPQDFWENNVNVSSPSDNPAFDEPTIDCPLLKSELGKRMLNALKSHADLQIKNESIKRAGVILSLPDDQRQIYVLRFYHSKTFREITVIMGKKDHKWVIRRFRAAEVAIKEACRPMEQCKTTEKQAERGP